MSTIPDYKLSPDQLDDKYNPDGDGEHPDFIRADWRKAVNDQATISGYWVWLSNELRHKAHENSTMFADQEQEDPQFTRAMWRMSITTNASTPGYTQWVQQTKRSLELLQEPNTMILSVRSVDEQWPSTPIAADRRVISLIFKPLSLV